MFLIYSFSRPWILHFFVLSLCVIYCVYIFHFLEFFMKVMLSCSSISLTTSHSRFLLPFHLHHTSASPGLVFFLNTVCRKLFVGKFIKYTISQSHTFIFLMHINCVIIVFRVIFPLKWIFNISFSLQLKSISSRKSYRIQQAILVLISCNLFTA